MEHAEVEKNIDSKDLNKATISISRTLINETTSQKVP
jgi:hypothetical protein